jgi:hypothetical protein
MHMILNKRRTIILSVIGFILVLPLISMQFSSEVNWTISDFIIAGILLLTIGLTIELVYKLATTKKQRLVFLAIVLILGLLTWVEMAVGIFGSPIAGS